MFLMMHFKIYLCFGTVYTLWVYPDLLPAFATWPPVLQKLAGGAGKSSRTLSLCTVKRSCLQGFLGVFHHGGKNVPETSGRKAYSKIIFGGVLERK